MDLAAELQKIYDSEINIEIGWFWDCGITVRLGDQMNGYLAEETVNAAGDIVLWLQEAIAHFYPDSTYAQSLNADVKARAETRLFRPPQTGAQVRCPHCGAPHANPGGFDEIFAFTCLRCGSFVEVPAATVQ